MPIDPNVPMMAFRGGAEQVSPMQTLQQMYQLQALQQHGQLQQQESAMRQQELGLRQQQFQAQQTEAQRKLAIEKQLDDAIASAPLNDDGTFDMEKLQQGIAGGNLGHLWPALQKTLSEADVHRLDLRKKRQDVQTAGLDAIGGVAATLQQLPPEQQAAAFSSSLGVLVRDEIVTRAQAAAMLDRISQDPTQIGAVIDQAIQVSPAQQKRLKEARELKVVGGSLYQQPTTPGQAPTFFTPPKQPEPYTLAPGGRRFDAQNQQVASVPLTPAQQHAGAADAMQLDPTMPATAKLMVARALAPVRGKDQKAGWTDQINQAYAAGPDEFNRTIKNAAIDNLNVDARNVVNARADALRAMNAFHTMLKQVPTNLLKGTAEKTVQALGTTTDPKLAKLAIDMESALISWRRGQTGAQFSLPEDASYRAIWPSISVGGELNLARVDGLVTGMRRNEREFWERRFGPEGADLLGAADPDVTGLGGGAGPLGGPGLTPNTPPLGSRRANPFAK